MIKWLAIMAVVAAGLFVLLAIAAFTGFADVPCQDGVWNEARQTCVPTRGP